MIFLKDCLPNARTDFVIFKGNENSILNSQEREVAMPKRVLWFILLVSFLLAGCAGSSKYMTQAEPPAGPSPGKALVYFMRPSGMGFAIHFQIWENYELIGLSQAKSYFAYESDPGRHYFIGRAENKRVVEADLEAGKTYYIITQVKMGAWKARMAFIPVTRGSEYWDKVEEYKQKLNFVVIEQAVADAWEADRRGEINAELDQIITYVKTPEGQKYMNKLNAADGR
jgi:hypothetical protein